MRRKVKTTGEQRCLKFGSPEYVVPALAGSHLSKPNFTQTNRPTSRRFDPPDNAAQSRPERTKMEREILDQTNTGGRTGASHSEPFVQNLGSGTVPGQTRNNSP